MSFSLSHPQYNPFYGQAELNQPHQLPGQVAWQAQSSQYQQPPQETFIPHNYHGVSYYPQTDQALSYQANAWPTDIPDAPIAEGYIPFKMDFPSTTDEMECKYQIAYFVYTCLACPKHLFNQQINRPFPEHLIDYLRRKASHQQELTTEEVFFLLLGGFTDKMVPFDNNTVLSEPGVLVLSQTRRSVAPQFYQKRRKNEIYVRPNNLLIQGRNHVRGLYRNIEWGADKYLEERCYFLHEKEKKTNNNHGQDNQSSGTDDIDDILDDEEFLQEIGNMTIGNPFHFHGHQWFLTQYREVNKVKETKASKKRKLEDNNGNNGNSGNNTDNSTQGNSGPSDQSSNNQGGGQGGGAGRGGGSQPTRTHHAGQQSDEPTDEMDIEEEDEDEDEDEEEPAEDPAPTHQLPVPLLPEFLHVHNILRSFSIDSSSIYSVVMEIAQGRADYQSIPNDPATTEPLGPSPDVIMTELFPATLGPITSREGIIEEFKSFLRVFVYYFPEIALYEGITEDEATPEAPPLSPHDFINSLGDILPNPTRVNQEYNKAIVKLLYAYHMIRDRSGQHNFFYSISLENYQGFIEIFHFLYSTKEEKLLFLYALAMNDLGKSTQIIHALKESQILPDSLYIDHDEKFYLYLMTLGSSSSSILSGWNSVQFSSSARKLLLDSQSTFINFPQLPQGEIVGLCLKKLAQLPKYVQSFRLILQIIDMAGAKSDLQSRKAIILTNRVYEHSIVGIHFILSVGEAAYSNYFHAIFRKDLQFFFEKSTEGRSIPIEQRSFDWFYYARTAALSRLNDHHSEDMIQIHHAWQLLRENNPAAFHCLRKEFILTGCSPEIEGNELAILIYFAPAIMDMCIQTCQKKFAPIPLINGKMKGIFYGLQTLALIYAETRADFHRHRPHYSRRRRQGQLGEAPGEGEEEDSYINVNAAMFVKHVRDNFAFFAKRKLVVLEEDIAQFDAQIEATHQVLSGLVLYSFVKYVTLLVQGEENEGVEMMEEATTTTTATAAGPLTRILISC